MGKIWKCVIIDVEVQAVEALEEYISNMPNMEVLKVYKNPLDALTEISTEDDIDFLFLDIDMPKITGLELAEALRNKTKYLVFTTAHSKFAINAFEVNADQFILKPVGMGKFALVINQLLKKRSAQLGSEFVLGSRTNDFFINTNHKNKLLRISPSEIIAIEGMDNYVKIHTVSGPVIAYFTMKELEEKFQGDDTFFRVQKSYIVAKCYIKHVEGHTIHCTNGLVIPIGFVYKAAFIDYLAQNTFRSMRKIGH